MAVLHICNTFFEQELECKAALHLKNWFESHPAVTQLQYLPLLYAGSDDKILVSFLPENPDPRLILMGGDLPELPIEAWGASAVIDSMAKEQGLQFLSPPVDLVRALQSKEFAFIHRPHVAGTALLKTPEEVAEWIQKNPGPKVLKRVFGFSGRGHFFVDKTQNLERFLAREFSENRPVLGEPWFPRKLDFSSQWEIGSTIDLQGLTTFETSNRGSYVATLAGPLDRLFGRYRWAADQHIDVALPILRKIQAMGFFGSLGIDAFVYGEDELHPIVEINVRKTMSRVALMMQKRGPSDRVLRMSFEAKVGGLLPGVFPLNIFLAEESLVI